MFIFLFMTASTGNYGKVTAWTKGKYFFEVTCQYLSNQKVKFLPVCFLSRCSSPPFGPEAPARSTSWHWAAPTFSAGRGPRPALLFFSSFSSSFASFPHLANTGSQNPPLMFLSILRQRKEKRTQQPTGPSERSKAASSASGARRGKDLAKVADPQKCRERRLAEANQWLT